MATVLSHLTAILLLVSSIDSDVPAASTALRSSYGINVQVIVEKKGFEHWRATTGKTTKSEMIKEIESVYFEVKKIFKRLAPHGIHIKVKAKVTILDRNLLTVGQNGKVDMMASTALTKFHREFSPTKYDMAVLYTGFPLSYGLDHPYGQMCNTRTALTVISLKTVYDDVIKTAHEIGHLLGAVHDKLPNTCGKAAEIGIMARDITKIGHNFHKFSSCSVQHIMWNLKNRIQSTCMVDWDIPAPRYGSLIGGGDETCKRVYGAASRVGRKLYNSDYSNVCHYLKCITATGTVAGTTFAPQGMNCGKGKICSGAKCVSSPRGNTAVLDACPFGDQPFNAKFMSASCASLAMNNGCKSNDIKLMCCYSCRAGQG